MTAPSENHPLLIAVLDLFADHHPQTVASVVDALNVSEDEALTALTRLEQLDVLVQSRGGTRTPVWKQHPDASEGALTVDGTDITP